jgi:hypothetical protein
MVGVISKAWDDCLKMNNEICQVSIIGIFA